MSSSSSSKSTYSSSSRSSKSSISSSVSSFSSGSSSSWIESTSSQTESTSSSNSSLSSLSSSTSSEIKATKINFDVRGIKWNASKVICSGISATNNAYVKNKQCQVIKIPFTTYTIEYVSCFLGKFNKVSGTTYDIVLEVYDTNDNGLPQTLMGSSTISSGDISVPAWYSFDFAGSIQDKLTPDNQLLAIVMYQDGGDEENYVYWYYSLNLSLTEKAYVSDDDGSSWTEQNGVTRSLSISDIFDVFKEAYVDSDLHALVFPPGKISRASFNKNSYLKDGEFDNTSLTGDEVAIQYKTSLMSFVVDSSGSMGWNDRYRDRIGAIRYLIDRLKLEYPGKTLFDIISFGSYRIGEFNFDASLTYITTKLDLNNPTSYSLNNDGSIPSISDGLLSWGLKKLEEEHEYIISSISFSPSETTIEDGRGVVVPGLDILSPLNYQNVGSQNNIIKFSIEKIGPGSELSTTKATNSVKCEVPQDNTNIIRKPFYSFRDMNTSFITKDIKTGDAEIFVDNYDKFPINSLIDVFDKEQIAYGLRIISKETINGENKIILDQAIEFNISNSFSENGGLVQESSVGNIFYIDVNDTMVELLIKDTLVSRAIVFYLQTAKGGRLEWEFTPFDEWQALLVVFAGDSALLQPKAFDSDGQPLPDGTRIDLYVDEIPRNIVNTKKPRFEKIIPSIKLGDSSFIIYENDKKTQYLFENVQEDSSIILKGTYNDELFTKRYTTTDVTPEDIADPLNLTKIIQKKTVTFSPIHLEPWEATEVMLERELSIDESLKLDLPISAVDISPIRTGRKLDPSLLQIEDPPQVDPASDPDSYNQSRERRRDDIINIPIIDGEGMIRVLPITEDIIETKENKNEKSLQFLDEQDVLTENEIIEKEQLNNSYLSQTSQTKKQQEVAMAPTEDVAIEKTVDYTIETPIYLSGGEAQSHMTTSTKTMDEYNIGNFKNKFLDDSSTRSSSSKIYSSENVLARKYIIYPFITVATDKKTIVQQMPFNDMYFVSPIQMSSCVVGSLYSCQSESQIPYVYAKSTNSLQIHYNVYYKGIFLKNGQMRIKIFDADRTPIDMLKPSEKYVDLDAREVPTSEQINYFHDDVDDLFINNVKGDDDSLLQEATYLPNYTEGGYIIDIVDGRAVLDVSSSLDINFTSHLKIYAEVLAPNDNRRSSIMQNDVFVMNPLKIIPILNRNIHYKTGADERYRYAWPNGHPCDDNRMMGFFGDNATKYNLGAIVTWMGESVPDNVLVDFQSSSHFRGELGSSAIWPATQITPGVAKTINGIAQDAYIGPHGVVEPRYVEVGGGSGDPIQVPMGDIEFLTIKTTFNDMRYEFNAQLMWMFKREGEEGEGGRSILYASAILYKDSKPIVPQEAFMEPSQECIVWSDGWDYRIILIDLSVSYRGGFAGIEENAPYLVGDVKIGEEQSKPVAVNFLNKESPQLSENIGIVEKFKPTGTAVQNSTYGKGIFTKTKPVDPVTNKPLELLVSNVENIPHGWAISNPIRKSSAPIFIKKAYSPTPLCQPTIGLYQYEKIWAEADFLSGTDAKTLMGCWSNNWDDCGCGEFFTEFKKPIVLWKEPLNGNIKILHDEEPWSINNLMTDGTSRTRADIDISFSGESIPIVAKRQGIVGFNRKEEEKKKKPIIFGAGLSTFAMNTINFAIFTAQREQDYTDQIWNYYAQQLRDHKNSLQPQGNLSLLNLKSEINSSWKDYFPNVHFEICLGQLIVDPDTGDITGIKNKRFVSALSLTKNDVLLSIKYTSNIIISEFPSSSSSSGSSSETIIDHFHECYVDDKGNGKTTKTFLTGNYKELDNHTHLIGNFIVQKALSDNTVHYHTLKSTVFTYINPFTISSLGYIRNYIDEGQLVREIIILHAWTEYDASREFVDRKKDFYLSWDILGKEEKEEDKTWTLTTRVDPVVFVQESTTNDYHGFNINVDLKRKDGVLPPDGTRVQIEISSYAIAKTEEEKEAENLAMEFNKEHEYFLISVEAKTDFQDPITGENLKLLSNKIIFYVMSDINWLPKIKHLLPEFTDDNIYIEEALGKIESIGSSQINDALAEASSKVKKYYLDNKDQDIFSSILLFTDGDENYSEHSFNYVKKIFSAGFSLPIYSVGLGNIGYSSKTLLNNYALITGGNAIELGAKTKSEMLEQIDNIIRTQQVNSGTYYNIMNLKDSYFIKEIIPSVNLLENTKMYISFQIGNYLNNLTSWSDEVEIVNDGQIINIENIIGEEKNKYIKYKIIMRGDEHFKSPSFLGCSTIYVQPQLFKIYSQPIEVLTNEVISEIIITHKTSENNLVEVEYGICLFDSTKEWNYYSDYNLLLGAGQRYITLPRYKEITTTNDLITYNALNGSWDDSLPIKIYSTFSPLFLSSSSSLSGNSSSSSSPLESSSSLTEIKSIYNLINNDEYIIRPSDGKMVFYKPRSADETIILSIGFPSKFRILCKVKNNSLNNFNIDHIGLIYNSIKPKIK